MSVFWKDTKSVFLGCNQAFALDSGIRYPNEIIGKTDYDLVPEAQAEVFRHNDVIVMGSRLPKLEYEIPIDGSDGKTRWLMASKVAMQDEDGNIVGVLGAHQDITERKQAEEAIRESNERFLAIFHGSNDCILQPGRCDEGASQHHWPQICRKRAGTDV